MFKLNNEATGNCLPLTPSALPLTLLKGEELVDPVIIFSEIYLIKRNERVRGKFYITNFRFFFKSDETYGKNEISKELNCQIEVIDNNYLIENILLGLVQKIDKIYSPFNSNELFGIQINCKNGRRLVFSKVAEDEHFEKLVYNYLITYSFPLSNSEKLFAFQHKNSDTIDEGWFIYDPLQEYERLGVMESKKWRISKINQDYKFCESYPNVFVIPNSTSDKELELIAEFRSKNRIPVLSWIKSNPINKIQNPALLRSSQPLCGMSGKKSYWDEMYLKNIAESNESNKTLMIFDARPYINALANCTTGGGYENEKSYTSCKLSFLNIENIHAVRDSFNSNVEKDSSLNGETCRWLEHIKSILDGVLKIIYSIDRDFSVLIHCSDGWDRTPQLTSLSMIVLDQYYRTLRGFQVLIEKEWLSFGHRFETRIGHGLNNPHDQDRSPIFLQFIDCVWQMQQQNEKFFEFNEKFLLEIINHVHSCQFGTFLFDSESKRIKNDVKTKTMSLWTHINNNILEFYNNSYMEYVGTLKFSSEISDLKLWQSFYSHIREDNETNTLNDLSNTSQKTNDSLSNLFENITPNFLSNGFKLFNHIKSNLRN